MKYIVHVFFLMVLVSSCKTTKEMPSNEVEEEQVEERIAEKQVEVGTIGKVPKSERMRRPKIDPEQIVAQLNMSEGQEKEFLDFWETNQAEMTKLREDSNGDRSAMREKMRAFRDNSQAKIEKILTAEQLAKYKQILAKDRMKSRRGQQ